MSHNEHCMLLNEQHQSQIHQIHSTINYQLKDLVSILLTNSSKIFYCTSIPQLICGIIFQAAQPEMLVVNLHYHNHCFSLGY